MEKPIIKLVEVPYSDPKMPGMWRGHMCKGRGVIGGDKVSAKRAYAKWLFKLYVSNPSAYHEVANSLKDGTLLELWHIEKQTQAERQAMLQALRPMYTFRSIVDFSVVDDWHTHEAERESWWKELWFFVTGQWHR